MADLIALMGLPGAGKTTLARTLARRTGLVLVDRDRIRAAMFPRGTFSGAEKVAAQTALWAAVRAHAGASRGCIVDGMTFADAGQRALLRGIAAAHGLPALCVLLQCPQREAVRRIRAQKAHAAGDRSARLVREVAARFAPPDAETLVLDARLPPPELAVAVLKRMTI